MATVCSAAGAPWAKDAPVSMRALSSMRFASRLPSSLRESQTRCSQIQPQLLGGANARAFRVSGEGGYFARRFLGLSSPRSVLNFHAPHLIWFDSIFLFLFNPFSFVITISAVFIFVKNFVINVYSIIDHWTTWDHEIYFIDWREGQSIEFKEMFISFNWSKCALISNCSLKLEAFYSTNWEVHWHRVGHWQ